MCKYSSAQHGLYSIYTHIHYISIQKIYVCIFTDLILHSHLLKNLKYVCTALPILFYICALILLVPLIMNEIKNFIHAHFIFT